jgi:hypothetical protein
MYSAREGYQQAVGKVPNWEVLSEMAPGTEGEDLISILE